jgi:hypothetical protein
MLHTDKSIRLIVHLVCLGSANAGATSVATNADADIMHAPARVGVSRGEEVSIDVLRKRACRELPLFLRPYRSHWCR